MPVIEVKLYDRRVTEESVPKMIEALTERAARVERSCEGAHPRHHPGRPAEPLGPGRQAQHVVV